MAFLVLVGILLTFILLYRWYRQSQILKNLSDKYVFITGCDSGFGNLLAKQLDQRGMRVLAACLTEKGAENLKKKTSSRLQTVILDVTDSQSVSSAAKLVAQAAENTGLWGLVNNAGINVPLGPNEWLKKDDFAKVLNVNLLGTIDVTLTLLPLIKKVKGRIVNVASVVGRISICGGGYNLSKFGVEAFSDSLRRDLRSFGVKVSIIEPGGFRTSIASNLCDNLALIWENLPAETKRSYGKKYYIKFTKIFRAFEKLSSTQLHRVTDCMEHALTACHPWTRYSSGWDAIILITLSYLPTFISDYLIDCFYPKPSMAVK